jgi:hypothetical protein
LRGVPDSVTSADEALSPGFRRERVRFLPEEAPAETLAALLPLLARQ